MRQGRACPCAALGSAQSPDQKLSFTAKLSRLLEALMHNVLDEAGGAGGQESWLTLSSPPALSTPYYLRLTTTYYLLLRLLTTHY